MFPSSRCCLRMNASNDVQQNRKEALYITGRGAVKKIVFIVTLSKELESFCYLQATLEKEERPIMYKGLPTTGTLKNII